MLFDSSKRTFKGLFKKKKTLPLKTVLAELSLSSLNELRKLLLDWSLDEYYGYNESAVYRNTTPTTWEKIKPKLKKAGKFLLKESVPIAIGLATGGAGLGAALGPAVNTISRKLKERGLRISEETRNLLGSAISEHSDETVEALASRLISDNRSNRGSPEELESLIRLSINEDLYPYVSEIKSALSELNDQGSDLREILEDWMDEQRDHQSLNGDILNRIESAFREDADTFEKHLNVIQENIERNHQSLGNVEKKLELIYDETRKKSLGEHSLDELFQISRIQVQNTRLAGKFDQPFDSDQFVPTDWLDDDFEVWFREDQDHPVFLLIAQMGMGKTWNAVHLAMTMRNKRYAIPFFIPLQYGYMQQLREVFPSESGNLIQDVGEASKRIFEKSGNMKRILLVFDGLDEIGWSNDSKISLLQFMERLMYKYSEYLKIVITTRLSDWRPQGKSSRSQERIGRWICDNPEFKDFCNKQGFNTCVSAYLDGFTAKQVGAAIERYGLSKNRFTDDLLAMCRRPYIIRLIFERDYFPDPSDPEAFYPLFYNPIDPSKKTILNRMNIVDDALFFLKELLELFLRKYKDLQGTMTRNDLKVLRRNNKDEWRTVILSSLLREEGRGLTKNYRFAPEFILLLLEFAKRNNIGGITIDGEEASPERELESEKILVAESGEEPRSQIMDDVILKLDLAEERYVKNRKPHEIQYDKLVAGYRNIQKYLEDEGGGLDLDIRKAKILELDMEIERVERNEQRIHKAEELFSKRKYREAMDEYRSSAEISRDIGWGDGTVYAENKINECQRLIIEREKLVREKDETLASATKNLEEGNYQDAISEFKKIREICTELEDSEGVGNADKMIKKCTQMIELYKPVTIPGTHVTVPKIEYNVLVELGELIGEDIPEVCYFRFFGFKAENNHIIGLGLYNKGLTSLPDTIGNLTSLQELNLYENNLSSLPDTIGNLKSLKTLKLQFNKLWSLPDTIDNLKSLENLELDKNNLSSLLETIGNLTSLKELNARDNNLSSLPDTIGNLTSLKVLKLYGNKLSSLPDSIGNLTSLKELKLQFNKLSSLPDTIGNLKSLEKLDLRSNDLSSLPERTKKILKQLENNGCRIFGIDLW